MHVGYINALPSSRWQDEISPYQASTNRQPRHRRSVSPTPVDTKYGGASLGICSNSIRSDENIEKYHQCRSLQSILGLILSGRAMSCTFHIRTASQQHTTYNFLRHLMTSISGLPDSIDPLRKVERTYAENAIGQGARAGSPHS